MHKSLHFVDEWVLTRLKEFRVPLELLILDSKSLRMQWNDPCREITRDRVVQSIVSLLDRHFIVATCGDDGDSISSPDILAFKGGKLDTSLLPDIRLEITPDGGHWWEEESHYDWDHHYLVDYQFEDDESADKAGYVDGPTIVTAGSFQRILYILKHPIQILRALFDPNSIRCEIVTSWQPVHWKTLPNGFRIYAELRNPGLPDEAILRIEEQTEKVCVQVEEFFDAATD